jgi:hypothetical protein
VKAGLGLVSLIFMVATRRRQSLHDLAAKSVVILKDPALATALDVAPEPHAVDRATLPSRLRRVIVIAVYSLTTFTILSIAASLAVSRACLDQNICSPVEDLLFDAGTVVGVLLAAVYMSLGWRGRLPGCRARSRDPSAAG